MQQNSPFVIIAAGTVMIGMALSAHAQNSSPYWSLAGNNNASSSSSKLGTTNTVPLRLFTNNSTRVFISGSTGNVGIGTGNSASSSYKLSVTGAGNGIY